MWNVPEKFDPPTGRRANFWSENCEMIGYMLTWTTYGFWLQGDRRGWVKDGVVYSARVGLCRSNAERLKTSPVQLTNTEQAKVYNAMLEHSCEKGHKIFAMAVTKNHVHLLIKEHSEGPGRLSARYKNNARKELGEKFAGKSVWTKGFDNRFCNNAEQLSSMIKYIKGHKKITPFVYID